MLCIYYVPMWDLYPLWAINIQSSLLSHFIHHIFTLILPDLFVCWCIWTQGVSAGVACTNFLVELKTVDWTVRTSLHFCRSSPACGWASPPERSCWPIGHLNSDDNPLHDHGTLNHAYFPLLYFNSRHCCICWRMLMMGPSPLSICRDSDIPLLIWAACIFLFLQNCSLTTIV